LVVLDNCEHLISDVADLAGTVLGECPTVWMLATSREALGVDGEQVWPLASLALPERAELDAAAANESVRLFVERAAAARPEFELGPTNVEAVTDICRRLDGIPLAIELAAARVSALSPSDIRGLLDERFRLLAGARRSKVERHQTLRATVDWSYSLLEENECVVFDRLGVFAGGFDARAAQAVCTGDAVEVWDVFDALTGLVAKSMVTAEEIADTSMRYQLLETLRQYARERIDETDEIDRWRSRHAAHYADVAEETFDGITGPDELTWRARLAADLDNIRAALNWSLDRGDQADVDYGLRIVAAIGRSTDPTLAFADWVERAVPLVEGRPPELRAAIISAAAIALVNIGDIECARALAEDVIRESPDSVYANIDANIRAIDALVIIASNEGDFGEAYRMARELLPHADDTTLNPYVRVTPHGLTGVYAAMTGDAETAHRHIEQAVQLARDLANPTTLAQTLSSAGMVYHLDEPERALQYLEESADLQRQGASVQSTGIALAYRARIRDERGELEAALDVLAEGIEHFRRVGPRLDITALFVQICRTFARNRRFEASAILAGVVSEGTIAEFSGAGTPERVSRASENARTELGDHTYQQLYQRGTTMTYADAIQYARTQLKELSDTTRKDAR
jgi:predicted ATPase